LTVNDLNPRPPSELDACGPDLTASHFTSPWTVQELEACFVVIDSSGQKLAFVYHQDEPSRRAAAKLPSKKTKRARSRRTSRSCRSFCANKNSPDYIKRPGPSLKP
jgi:hypothetical protein